MVLWYLTVSLNLRAISLSKPWENSYLIERTIAFSIPALISSLSSNQGILFKFNNHNSSREKFSCQKNQKSKAFLLFNSCNNHVQAHSLIAFSSAVRISSHCLSGCAACKISKISFAMFSFLGLSITLRSLGFSALLFLSKRLAIIMQNKLI